MSVTKRSQAQKSGRVRRTNDRFTLKMSAPDFRGPLFLRHSALETRVLPQDVVVDSARHPNRSWCWLARQDSNLRSPDPESGDRFSRFLARREHETHRFLPQILPSLVTYRKRGQVATGGSPDSLAAVNRWPTDCELIIWRRPEQSQHSKPSGRENDSRDDTSRRESCHTLTRG